MLAGVIVKVAVKEDVLVRVSVGVAVPVKVGVGVAVLVKVRVRVLVKVRVGVEMGKGVQVTWGAQGGRPVLGSKAVAPRNSCINCPPT